MLPAINAIKPILFELAEGETAHAQNITNEAYDLDRFCYERYRKWGFWLRKGEKWMINKNLIEVIIDLKSKAIH